MKGDWYSCYSTQVHGNRFERCSCGGGENNGKGSGFVAVEIPFTPRAKHVLEISLEEACQLGHNYAGSEHLLLGLLSESEGVAALVLENLGADPKKYSHTGYSNGKLDPVVGRQDKIERVTQILGRCAKNNPCLIGEPGVGKVAIAEGLALRIANGDVPETIEGKKDSTSIRIKSLVTEELKQYFRPEFLNRLDDMIAFRQLTKLEVMKIADIMLRSQGYKTSDSVVEKMLASEIKEGYSMIVDVDSDANVIVLNRSSGASPEPSPEPIAVLIEPYDFKFPGSSFVLLIFI
ncbi:ATP-dependent Clp protease ATP-binding subunit [Olea europaea subsp. europaea]|uniref:ATP-dependent Clp protease ATP-binding subunit n=1 Tax=Olea europaea subsp. europaea TaxID=158383 RepID=A0A8S0RAI0_OLEEU|nr:ATP-dependent Clp protease ATP-binding subunit [Olea europaea subsp. europaea]